MYSPPARAGLCWRTTSSGCYTETAGRSGTGNKHSSPSIPLVVTVPHPAYFPLFTTSRLPILFTGMLVVVTCGNLAY